MITLHLESIYYHVNYVNSDAVKTTDLREAVLRQHDNALVVWETHPEPHREQSLHGGHNERGVCGIKISLLLHLFRFMVVELSTAEV